MSGLHTRESGFTIVELIIAIVIIGILAALSLAAYGEFQKRASNATRITELRAWQKLFAVYKAQAGTYPDVPNAGYCLGLGFPVGGGGVARCRDYTFTNANSYVQSDNAALMNELRSAGSLPTGLRTPVNGTVGPYAIYSTNFIELYAALSGGSADCPKGVEYSWDDGAGRVLCYISIPRLE